MRSRAIWVSSRNRSCSAVEERVHWPAKQYFDWQFFCFVFVRRLLPFEFVGIQTPNRSDDFDACFKRTEAVSIDNVELRAAAKLTGKFLERRLEIVFTKKKRREALTR